MTIENAIDVLIKCATLGPQTELAEACHVAVDALNIIHKKEIIKDCYNCLHAKRMPDIYPCSNCRGNTNWEPKEMEKQLNG